MIPIPISIPRVDPDKKPEHVGVGLLQGLNKWCDQVGTGAQKLWNKPQEGYQREGALGSAKGVGEGLLGLASGVGKGACDFVGSTLEGVRHTPDAVANAVNKDRKHQKHGVSGEGSGELLETYIEEEDEANPTGHKEPEHIGEGLVTGVKAAGRGLYGGLEDLAMRPYQGAKDGGAKGFAEGLAHGVLGFGTKTATGTLDLASSLVYGAKNTPDAIEKAVKSSSFGSGAGQQKEEQQQGTGSRGSSGHSSSSTTAAAGGSSVPTFAGSSSSSFKPFAGQGQSLGAS